MTKEELKKEAEEYALNQWEGQNPWGVIQKAYYDSAEPREKRIAELEQEVLEVRQHLDLTEREWGKDLGKQIHFKTLCTRAKEIIKDLLGSENTSCEEEMFFEIRQKAEQFLKEE